MNIGIAGLGLIGASLAKSVKLNTGFCVFGTDIAQDTVLKARMFDTIDEELNEENIAFCDYLLIALYPKDAIDYVRQNAAHIKKGAVVIDCCGIKQAIVEALAPIAKQYGFTFIGGHPMAGRAHSGFDHSSASIFEKATMILTPEAETDIQTLKCIKDFFLKLGFVKVILTTPEVHDHVIAHTSQLAHVLSSAYVKTTPTDELLFTGGSYADMTRVASMNEEMWSELFLLNGDQLTLEIDDLIRRLKEYSAIIKKNDTAALRQLLREGTQRKAQIEKNQLER